MESEPNSLGKALLDINLLLTNQIEGFNADTKHKNVNIDTEFKILHLLDQYGRLTTTELVEKLCIAKSNLSNQCKLMIRDGLIKQFSAKDDKRIVCYGLCEKGRIKYLVLLNLVVSNFNQILSPEKLEKISQLTQEISKLLK